MKALIGHSGFVGTTLKRQQAFDRLYRSTDIANIRGQRFDLVVCAGVPAKKWIADREPEADMANIQALADHLDTVQADRFVLISTVDVFADSRGCDEDSPVDAEVGTPYGRHRRWLERFVADRFAGALTVRLPGLVGPGLRKNVLFDFVNNNNLHAIDSRGVFQFYPMVNLSADIAIAADAGLELVHLAAEPISVADIAANGFGRPFDTLLEQRTPAVYDLRTRHAALFGGRDGYQYSRRESLLAIRAYAQSEPLAESAD